MIIAGTGHRTHRLQGRDAQVQGAVFDLLTELRPTEVISGMADGFDMYLALAALEQDIPLTAAVPFMGHGSRVSQEVYDFIKSAAKRVVYTCEYEYKGAWQYLLRDQWMVDNCDLLLACWDGEPFGGTYVTVEYAIKVGRPVRGVQWLK